MTEMQIKQEYNRNLKRYHRAIEWYMHPDRTLGEQLSQEENFCKVCRRLGELAHMLENKLTDDEWFNGFEGVGDC